MNVQQQIKGHLDTLPEPKRSEIEELHKRVINAFPECELWFDNGKNSENKTVANPAIGYGFQTLKYANGKTKDFFRIGLSATKTGISVYILGIKDKKYLAQTFGKDIGKANVTGYCISFKTLKDIDIEVLEAAIKYGLEIAPHY